MFVLHGINQPFNVDDLAVCTLLDRIDYRTASVSIRKKDLHQFILTFPGCILHTALGGDEMCAVSHFEPFEPGTTFLDHALDRF